MKPPIVSVLMTAYNREKYIAEAIESVLASTLTDFELIIVDDASTDRTVEIANRFSSDQRVQIHVNEENLGDYHNRNRAASLAQGKYLKYLDSDDLVYAHGLEVMVSAMEQFPEAALGLPNSLIKDRPYPLQVTAREAYKAHFLNPDGGLFGHCPSATIIRTRPFRDAGGFSGKRYVGDTEMWLKLGAKSPVVVVPQDLIWWRSHDEQEIAYGTTAFDYAKWDYLVALGSLVAPECPFDHTERTAAIRRLKRRHARQILHIALWKRLPLVSLNIKKETEFSYSDLLRAFSAGY